MNKAYVSNFTDDITLYKYGKYLELVYQKLEMDANIVTN